MNKKKLWLSSNEPNHLFEEKRCLRTNPKKMCATNAFISVFILGMLIQTVLNLPVDAVDMKKEEKDTTTTMSDDKKDKSERLEESDMDRVYELADTVSDRLARFLFQTSSGSSGSVTGLSDLFSSATDAALNPIGLLNLKIDKKNIVQV